VIEVSVGAGGFTVKGVAAEVLLPLKFEEPLL
jgi:hypothetical protein